MLDKINNEILPRALMMGVDYDLFWKLNPKSLAPFVKAFEMKWKHQDEINHQLGIYIQLAVASCLDGKKVQYPKNPFSQKLAVKRDMTAEEIKEKMLSRMKVLNSRFVGE